MREDGPTDPKVMALDDLAAAAKKKAYPDGLEAAVPRLLESSESGIVPATARLAGILKLESSRSKLEDCAHNAFCRDGTAALKALVCLGGEKTREFLRWLYAEKCKPRQRIQGAEVIDESDMERANILCALIDLDAAQALPDVIAHVSRFPDDGFRKIIFEAFLSSKDGCAVIALALQNRRLPTSVATAGLRLARSAGNRANELIEALKTAGGIE